MVWSVVHKGGSSPHEAREMGDVLLATNHDDRVSSRDQVAGSADHGEVSVFWLRDSLALQEV
jgi:hypothetical protein